MNALGHQGRTALREPTDIRLVTEEQEKYLAIEKDTFPTSLPSARPDRCAADWRAGDCCGSARLRPRGGTP